MGKKAVTDEAIARLAPLVEPELDRAELGQWAVRGRCVDADPDLFFPPRNNSGREARAICSGCEVRKQCLAYATANANEIYGIWGGLDRGDRLRLRAAAIASRSSGQATSSDAA
jgi:WhiB family redox-sensing transcriptional regulator